jgi:lipopolysaccharide export system protein LptA
VIKRRCNQRTVKAIATLLAVGLTAAAVVLAVPDGSLAQSDAAVKGSNEKIVIVSDKLVSNNKEQFAEFTGHVKATQGTTEITADRLKIYYANQGDKQGGFAPGEESIQKIVASGKVTIKMDEREARSEKAVYETANGILILTGAGSRVASGDNYVAGEKITLYRNEDRMTVESAAKQRVEAVFYPGKRGIQ